MAKLRIELEQSKTEIKTYILRAFLREIKSRFNKVSRTSTAGFKAVLEQAVKSQPEYHSLVNGELQAELGIVDSATRLEQIIDVWLSGIITDVSVRIVGKKITGFYSVKLPTKNYANILPLGVYNSINSRGEITTIPWLQWLLLDGNVTIVKYRFGTKPQEILDRYSRTKRGLMFPTLYGRWTMPAQFAGTENNNFLTRAVASASKEIQLALEQEFQKVFS